MCHWHKRSCLHQYNGTPREQMYSLSVFLHDCRKKNYTSTTKQSTAGWTCLKKCIICRPNRMHWKIIYSSSAGGYGLFLLLNEDNADLSSTNVKGIAYHCTALESKSQISIRHICLILKLALYKCHIVIIIIIIIVIIIIIIIIIVIIIVIVIIIIIIIIIRPFEKRTYHAVAMFVRPGFLDFFSTCFAISIWNLVYTFSRWHDMSSLSCITIGSLWPSLQPKVGQTHFLQSWPHKSR